MNTYDIPGYPGYKLTEDFNIIGKTGKVLSVSGKKHLYVNVYNNNQTHILYLHRAIALVHVSGYFAGAWVDHIDDNPKNNHPSNLRWVSARTNNSINKSRKLISIDSTRQIELKIKKLKNKIDMFTEQITYYETLLKQ